MNSEEPVQIEPDNFRAGIIIGGGTCGLAVASRLCENHPGSLFTEDEHQRFHWLKQRGHKTNKVKSNQRFDYDKFHPEDLLVIDARGDKFLTQWDAQFNACQIPYLRSPMFFHIDPSDIDGMISFAHLNKREKELMEITNVVGKEFSKHQQKRIKQKLKSNDGIVDINMRDWKDYYRPSTKLFHDYCAEVVARYGLQNSIAQDEVVDIEHKLIQSGENSGKGFVIRTMSGKVYGCKFAVVASGHRGKINYPPSICPNPQFPHGSCHTTHLFSNQVKFLDSQYFANPKRKNVVIIGGGLTSAQLAHVACHDATVDTIYLIFRSGIKIKHFDFHLDWVAKYKNVKKSSFYNLDTNELKYEMMNDAREGGSINPEYYKKIKQHVKNGRLKWLTETQVVEQEWEEDTWRLLLKNKHGEATSLEKIDYVYYATGIQADIESLPFMRTMFNQNPIDVCNGYPSLTDNLQWNKEIPLYMVGKNAALQVGPTSANLDGARLGAERIGWHLQNMKLQGEFDWSPVKVITTENTRSSTFDKRLQLAGGSINWFELLEFEKIN
ncbi:hypothetical protein CORT_0G01080 [Candida orthopsilosis Co 90-125]|uniref:L-ornithine N(5)-monooxygenase [NAD(P)H] n=1 Tax=Candida orthopsilosis (strain 90-125) TaxID=1136231 RepID=H8X9X9_CANO9|nr:hypothetical protein CORT_0G01080 [Candida orthopsilosis Co 90-125]CCG24796.1 hypothetical protein CORT_0G01080 [Candida orthopsilosis Co 90-125]